MADTLPPLDDADVRRWRACVRRFWLHRHAGASATAAATTEPADSDVVQGPALPVALRASFPAGVTLSASQTQVDWTRAVERTHIALAQATPEAEGWALFGACLSSDDGARAWIDLITRGAHGWRLFKLRYATVGTEADVDAVALWAHVAARCGLRVQSVGLLLVDTGFIYPGHGCYAGLLREVDLGPTLGSRPVGTWLAAMQACARGAAPPVPPGAPCTQPHPCEQLPHCALPQASVRRTDARARLEVVGREMASQLRAAGHADLHSVPLEALPDARLRRATRAVQQDAPVLEPEAAAVLRALPYPRHFLRFETIGFAVPVWAGTRPYQVLPFQWSCDTVAAAGQPPQPLGFLAGPTGDPGRAFAQSLLQALGAEGAILAYNAGFERNRLRELAAQFEDMGPALLALAERIVDLFQIARAHYYHPAMAGSWSAKSVFAAIAPDLGAERFDCEGQGTPLEAFARSLQPGLPAAELQRLRAALHAHGQRQTAALRRLVALFEHRRESANPP
ncbi:DUF2779 domain-containing protein [Ideonella oryzae]|uniref:DUF2779 domain-containing protein n=1 Tax=Ideonella oryzae TaxID=2937441 RepID=A0ABT1BGV7_9BURK|nr:DUF2779 domain-containing protein [Ideonella oryzae]MCO5975293.1 DUF2779 domain-containing protein [Ideonella oryzae]